MFAINYTVYKTLKLFVRQHYLRYLEENFNIVKFPLSFTKNIGKFTEMEKPKKMGVKWG